jgi:hypothetical protein
MQKVPLRVGVWFNSSHVAYGGPSLVLLGTILGLQQQEDPIIILLNEVGDVNWCMDKSDTFQLDLAKAPNMYIGPLAFSSSDAETEDYTQNNLWKYGSNFLVPSHWYRWWIAQGLPFDNKEKAGHRICHIWGSGVDIDYFRPIGERQQDYFIYFKSQNYPNLQKVHQFLFNNYFHYRGTVLTYYHYDKEMLREQANKSRFCIMVDNTETQGLASLEIMACNCPLFVLDCTQHKGHHIAMDGATSVPCMDQRCGVKTSWERMEQDFPMFLKGLSVFRPREFVSESFSFKSAAKNLLQIMTNR